MSSFSHMGVWPVGYFRAFSSWLLRNRRDVARRIDVINAEILRIGDVTVVYGLEVLPDSSVRRTENRVGFRVTPGSSLGKLVRAYIVQGGNPFDISPFMKPNSTEVIAVDQNGKPLVVETYPHGGIAAPVSVAPNESGQGGFIRMDSFFPTRHGGRVDPGAYAHDAVVRNMHHMRDWARQDIDERLRRVEWEIVKLCDLREQLIRERDEVLAQAFGGVLTGVPDMDEAMFNPAFMVQNLVQEMYDLIYEKDATTGETTFKANANVPRLRFAIPDVASEVGRDPLG